MWTHDGVKDPFVLQRCSFYFISSFFLKTLFRAVKSVQKLHSSTLWIKNPNVHGIRTLRVHFSLFSIAFSSARKNYQK